MDKQIANQSKKAKFLVCCANKMIGNGNGGNRKLNTGNTTTQM